MNLVGVDWSAEAFRAWRFDGDGTVIDRRRSRAGLTKAARRGHEETLLRHIGGWLEPGTLVVLAGAFADRRGWTETPFLDVPVGLSQLLDGGVRQPLREATLLALPGLARRPPGRVDLMRREALTALGAVGDGSPDGGAAARLLVVPGARSRWIRTAGGRIETFCTAMGGELLDLLLESPFGESMPPGGTEDDPAFLEGVEQGYRSRHVVTDLFAARAATALDERDPAAARAHLAGLLIGNEIREAEGVLEATGEALTLLGGEARCAPHARALRHLGTSVAREDDEAAAIAGFAAIRAALPDARHGPSVVPPAARRAVAPVVRSEALPSGPVEAGGGEGIAPETEPASEPACRGWADAFAELPLVAFLPRVDEDRALGMATRLVDAGFRLLVVSARAPGALGTIERLAGTHGERTCIGVRDVVTPKEAGSAITAGARVVVASGVDVDVARRCRKRGVDWVPGAATVTEANAALALGARALLLYPAEQIEPRVLHAIARALPPDTALLPVGGLTARTLLPYAAAGAAGAVIDERLLNAEADSEAIDRTARAFVAAWRRVERGRHALTR